MASASTVENDNQLKLPPGGDLDIILIGRSRNGKRSTGNTILGRKAFHDLGSKRKHQVGYREIDGRVIKVVDTLGYCHEASCSHKEESTQAFSEALSKGLSEFPTGFSAIAFILSFAKPITKTEIEVISALKEIMGDDVMKKNGIVLITHGDVLNAKLLSKENDRSDKGGNDCDDCEEKNEEAVKERTNADNEVFQNWCKEQTGPIHDILKEFNFRCVAFNNSCEDPLERKTQLVKLVSRLDKINSRNTKFTVANYVNKDKKKDEIDPKGHLKKEYILPMILQAIHKQMSLIENRIAVYKYPHLGWKQGQHDHLLEHSQKATYGEGDDGARKGESNDEYKALNNDDKKLLDHRGHQETGREKQRIDMTERDENYLDILKIKDKIEFILREIKHHEPEKLNVLKTDLEGINNLTVELLSSGGHKTEHEHSHNREHNDVHGHEHDHKYEPNDHHHVQRYGHKQKHDTPHSPKSKGSMKGLFKRGEIGDEHLSLILQHTDSVQEKIQEIKEQESWYHSWINTEIISLVRACMDTIFPF